jgi:predicted Zn-ribbon and HTH transcriptional regulator
VSREREPAERATTLRQAIAEALRRSSLTALELSAEVKLSTKELADHLTHLERSLRSGGERLVIEPAVCRGCGHAFEGRSRHARPSRCPKCKSERISAPRFSITSAGP